MDEIKELTELERETNDKLKSIPREQRGAILDETKKKIPGEKNWTRNSFYVPKETEIRKTPYGTTTAFRTHDREIYTRDGITGVIRSRSEEVKGKAAKKAAKRNRHASRMGLQRNISSQHNAITETNEKKTEETKKETTEELIARLKGMMK